MLIERIVKEVKYLIIIIPREVDRDDDQKNRWRNCLQTDSRRKIKSWERTLKADPTEGRPSRRRRSALDCSTIIIIIIIEHRDRYQVQTLPTI